MLGLTKVAMGVAATATSFLTGAFTTLWAATGIGLIAIALLAAGFAAFKFAKWIADVGGLGEAWLKFRHIIGTVSEAEKRLKRNEEGMARHDEWLASMPSEGQKPLKNNQKC